MGAQERINRARGKIADCKKRIKELEDAYDSLSEFKNSIGSVQGSVVRTGTRIIDKLGDLKTCKKYNHPSDDFSRGMSNTVLCLGTGTISLAFMGLDVLASTQGGLYKAEILKEEGDILLYEAEIKEAQMELAVEAGFDYICDGVSDLIDSIF